MQIVLPPVGMILPKHRNQPLLEAALPLATIGNASETKAVGGSTTRLGKNVFKMSGLCISSKSTLLSM